MSRFIAPGTISSEMDLVEFYVETAEPVDPNSPKSYAERCIHSEILKRFSSVNAVVHSHSEAVLPYTISGVPMRPCYHMAGFLDSEATPIYDIARHYQQDDIRDMLVRNTRLGSSLAACFGGNESAAQRRHSVVLMRGHGFTAVGGGIVEAVAKAIYTQTNAGIQTSSLLTRAAFLGGAGSEGAGIQYLSEEEAEAAAEMTKWTAARPWRLWVREVESSGMYVNTA